MATELAGQFRHKAFLIDGQKSVQGNDVRLAGGVTTDFPKTGGKVMPAGAVVVKKAADGLYYLANDSSNGDRNTGAAITSAENPDGDWADKTLTWTLYLPDGTVETGTVVASGGDETSAAAWVTLLQADAEFNDRFTAADSSGDLVITTRRKGKVAARIQLNLTTAYETVDGSNSYTDAEGSEADYRVINEQRSLVDVDGASRDSDPVATLLAGHFDESELTGLTPEAKAVLQGRDSIFG